MKPHLWALLLGFAFSTLLCAVARAEPGNSKKPVKVFVLAGQSNMEGKAKVSLLDYQVKQPATRELFKHYEKDGQWAQREDVWIKFFDRKGNLTVGYGSPNCIGPELEFGHVVGERCDEQVLLIKTAWGGRSLYRDFRSPSAGLPDDKVLDKLLADAQKRAAADPKNKPPAPTLEDIKAPFGASYRAMLAEVRQTLDNLKTHFPAYQGQGYELSGLVWFQGWNDMINAEYTSEYTANLAHFVRDVRRDLKSPDLPFVVVQMGVDGVKPSENAKRFKDAQAAVINVGDVRDNLALVKSDVFWDLEAEAVFKKGWRENLEAWNKVGSDFPYHYLGSPKTLCAIGKASAEAVLALESKAK